MASSNPARVGSNLTIAALLALLSYVPFEIVAKGSLIFGIVLFVLDPIPPITRLLAILSVVVVAILSRAHTNWLNAQGTEDPNENVTNRSAAGDTNRSTAGHGRRPRKED